MRKLVLAVAAFAPRGVEHGTSGHEACAATITGIVLDRDAWSGDWRLHCDPADLLVGADSRGVHIDDDAADARVRAHPRPVAAG